MRSMRHSAVLGDLAVDDGENNCESDLALDASVRRARPVRRGR